MTDTETKYRCPTCLGIGYVDWAFEDDFGNDHYLEHDCPMCEGGGYLTVEHWEHYCHYHVLDEEEYPPEWITNEPVYKGKHC